MFFLKLNIKEVTIPVPWGSVRAQIFGEITPNKTPILTVVKYFELEKFIFMTHSYGTTMALLYDTVFQGELKAIVGIDWIFGYSARKWVKLLQFLNRFCD